MKNINAPIEESSSYFIILIIIYFRVLCAFGSTSRRCMKPSLEWDWRCNFTVGIEIYDFIHFVIRDIICYKKKLYICVCVLLKYIHSSDAIIDIRITTQLHFGNGVGCLLKEEQAFVTIFTSVVFQSSVPMAMCGRNDQRRQKD